MILQERDIFRYREQISVILQGRDIFRDREQIPVMLQDPLRAIFRDREQMTRSSRIRSVTFPETYNRFPHSQRERPHLGTGVADFCHVRTFTHTIVNHVNARFPS